MSIEADSNGKICTDASGSTPISNPLTVEKGTTTFTYTTTDAPTGGAIITVAQSQQGITNTYYALPTAEGYTFSSFNVSSGSTISTTTIATATFEVPSADPRIYIDTQSKGKVVSKTTASEVTDYIDNVTGANVEIADTSISTLVVTRNPSSSPTVEQYSVISNKGYKFVGFTGATLPVEGLSTTLRLVANFEETVPGEVDLGIPPEGYEIFNSAESVPGLGTVGGAE